MIILCFLIVFIYNLLNSLLNIKYVHANNQIIIQFKNKLQENENKELPKTLLKNTTIVNITTTTTTNDNNNNNIIINHNRNGRGYFKFANDPKYCDRRKYNTGWITCFAKGNVENLRENFLKFNLIEVPAFPTVNSGNPFQLLWELADQADTRNFKGYKLLNKIQKINHFPGVRELGNKAFLQRNMQVAVNKYGLKIYNIFPLSFKVPIQIEKFTNVHNKLVKKQQLNGVIINNVNNNNNNNNKISWILKLSGKDRGEGLKLINGPNDLDKKSRGIVQQYIKNPYLLNGRKFTIRLYAVYTSLKPARIYVYPEGFCHIATEKYSSNVKEIKNRYMHITNPDISGKRDFYKKNPRPYYWSISEMRNYMRKNNVDDDKLWGEIKVLVAKTLLSGIDNLKKYSRKIKISNEFDIMKQQNCFELIGLDILVDANFKPWLLEVNPDPDLSAKSNFPLAKHVKSDLLHDLLQLIGILPLDPSFPQRTKKKSHKQEFIDKMTELLFTYPDNSKAITFLSNNMFRDGIFYGKLLHADDPKYVSKHAKCHIITLYNQCKFISEKDFIQYIPEFVESELELRRIQFNKGAGSKFGKRFERVLPSPDPSYLKWFETKKDNDIDKFMSCFEKAFIDHRCGKKNFFGKRNLNKMQLEKNNNVNVQYHGLPFGNNVNMQSPLLPPLPFSKKYFGKGKLNNIRAKYYKKNVDKQNNANPTISLKKPHTFFRTNNKKCEYNCQHEWIADKGHYEMLKNLQRSPKTDDFLKTIVNFLGENKVVELATDKAWEARIIRDKTCNFNIIDLGSSVPVRSIELCRFIKCCNHLSAMDPSKLAMKRGRSYAKERLGDVFDFKPIVGLINTVKASAFGKKKEQYDLVMTAQMLQHVPRTSYVETFKILHDNIKFGGHIITNEISMAPLNRATIMNPKFWVPLNLYYRRMENCIHGEIFSAYLYLTQRYEYEYMLCDKYSELSKRQKYVSYVYNKKKDANKAMINIPEPIDWYKRKMDDKEISNKYPKGRMLMDGLGDKWAYNMQMCTGILRKKKLNELPPDLPPFEKQISSIIKKLKTPGYDKPCKPAGRSVINVFKSNQSINANLGLY